MDDVRVQVVNYRTKNYLIQCLETVFTDIKSSDVQCSVAVVDNNSGESLADLPSRFPGERIETYQNDRNIGFGGGQNYLARHSKFNCKYILLLNPDVKIIEPRTIARLLNTAKRSGAHVIGPRLVTEDGRTHEYDHGELRGWHAWRMNAIGHSYWRERAKPVWAAWVCGAAFLIREKSFTDVGGFDEDYFLYKEEEDLCLRVRRNRGRILYDPTISLFHVQGVVASRSEHMQRSVDTYIQKNYSARWTYRFLKRLGKT